MFPKYFPRMNARAVQVGSSNDGPTTVRSVEGPIEPGYQVSQYPSPLMMASPISAAQSVASLVRDRAQEAESARRLPAVVVDALVAAGLMRLFVPRIYGGPEAEPLDGLSAIETVACADGAAGWCVNIASTTSSMSWYLDPHYAQAIYGDPLTVTGGAFAPSGTGRRVDNGYRIEQGRWQWGSGTQHCQWVNCGVRMDDGTFQLAYVPAADVEFADNWHAAGLKGTGSTDFMVHDAFVPDGRSLQPGVTRTRVDSPLCHFPNFGLLAAGLASVALGIGRRAIEELVSLATQHSPTMSRQTLAETAIVQIELARAEAQLGSARAFLHDEVGQAWLTVTRGDRVEVQDRARLRLACHHAAAESAGATDRAYTAAGGSAVYSSNPLQRCLRDIHVATQHAMLSPRTLETFAKVRLGLPADTALL